MGKERAIYMLVSGCFLRLGPCHQARANKKAVSGAEIARPTCDLRTDKEESLLGKVEPPSVLLGFASTIGLVAVS